MTFTYNIYSGKIAISNCDMSSLEESMNSPIVKFVNPTYELIFEITNLPLNTVRYDGQYNKISFDTLKVINENGVYKELKDISTYQINPDQNNRFEIFRENFGDPNLVNLRMEYQQHYHNQEFLSTNHTEKVLSRNQLYYFVIRKTDMNLLKCNQSKPCAIIIRKK